MKDSAAAERALLRARELTPLDASLAEDLARLHLQRADDRGALPFLEARLGLGNASQEIDSGHAAFELQNMDVDSYYRVSTGRREPSEDKAGDKSVNQPDDTSGESYFEANKVMAEKSQIGSDDVAPLDQKDVR